mmetsp:Transcript_60514/g.72754  ORF Transcript_60514/g.72754 Transcript_60514/m.72754 type:complete len:301 (-) Transcript_60514:397-1299(-)|eukprot:CAMPEP_0194373370 /NCGR_PEP_ID=MMETSP0174-20130528/21796_1 /TAXON_ID=216777 /ORGANISM="Proboscia alata, Strain PI-D3" /LENGTH=300 /DNA_ID=CAMNT_0039152397 /DNA_START=344 /DNA_END=1246 /DNA_ORIENTATION=+
MVRATLKYERQKEESLKKVKLEILQTTGRMDKIEVYTCEDGPEEDFLILVQDFKDADRQFNIRNAITIDEYYGKFRECMKGSARDTWDKIAGTVAWRTTMTFYENLLELVKEILGEDAKDNQKDYIRNTKKPVKMPAGKWVRRLKTINNIIKLMGDGAESLTEKQLVTECIAPNIHIEWKGYFKLSKGHRSRTTQEAKAILEDIEDEYPIEKLRKNVRNPKGNFSRNSQESGHRNKCRKPGYDPEWENCPDHKYSKVAKAKAREDAEKKKEEKDNFSTEKQSGYRSNDSCEIIDKREHYG